MNVEVQRERERERKHKYVGYNETKDRIPVAWKPHVQEKERERETKLFQQSKYRHVDLVCPYHCPCRVTKAWNSIFRYIHVRDREPMVYEPRRVHSYIYKQSNARLRMRHEIKIANMHYIHLCVKEIKEKQKNHGKTIMHMHGGKNETEENEFFNKRKNILKILVKLQ